MDSAYARVKKKKKKLNNTDPFQYAQIIELESIKGVRKPQAEKLGGHFVLWFQQKLGSHFHFWCDGRCTRIKLKTPGPNNYCSSANWSAFDKQTGEMVLPMHMHIV